MIMKWNMNNKILTLAITLAVSGIVAKASDSIPSAFSHALEWRVGADISPAYVIPTNGFLRGGNPEEKKISSSLTGAIRSDFSFNPSTCEGILYKGLYQGIGIGFNTYFSKDLLGTPVSVYAYQGAPIVHFSNSLSLGYEWQFGAAFGWHHFDKETAEKNYSVSTSVTAHMGLGLNLNYSLTDRWQMSVGIMMKHYSNGNTSLPNAGVNTLGATIGVAYVINPQNEIASSQSNSICKEADKGRWAFDIMAYGAWRKRVVTVGDPSEALICPGKFGILGLQFSPLRVLNRWVAAGPSLEFQWDESASLTSYWVEGTSGDNIKFKRPPFAKQLSLGLAAHAELTMPIFTVNAGIGYEIINPKGDRAFYQSLTLKTFITKTIYINTGYRIGRFHDPQNLMLGIGVRL